MNHQKIIESHSTTKINVVQCLNKLTSTKEGSANLNNGDFRIVRSLTNFVFSPLISYNYITERVIRPPAMPPGLFITCGTVLITILWAGLPSLMKFYLMEKGTFPYIFGGMCEKWYILKSLGLNILKITLFQFVFKCLNKFGWYLY